MISLLRLIRDHPGALEADLSRYHHMDVRDYWRRGPDGRRLLTLRQIATRVRWGLPVDSAVARVLGGPTWTRTDYLLADVVHALTGKQHPARPEAAKPGQRRDDPRRRRARADALRRKRDREDAIRQGRLT